LQKQKGAYGGEFREVSWGEGYSGDGTWDLTNMEQAVQRAKASKITLGDDLSGSTTIGENKSLKTNHFDQHGKTKTGAESRARRKVEGGWEN